MQIRVATTTGQSAKSSSYVPFLQRGICSTIPERTTQRGRRNNDKRSLAMKAASSIHAVASACDEIPRETEQGRKEHRYCVVVVAISERPRASSRACPRRRHPSTRPRTTLSPSQRRARTRAHRHFSGPILRQARRANQQPWAQRACARRRRWAGTR